MLPVRVSRVPADAIEEQPNPDRDAAADPTGFVQAAQHRGSFGGDRKIAPIRLKT